MATLAVNIDRLLWSERDESLSGARRLGIRLLRMAWAVVRDALAGDLPLRAMGLVYVTILSIVPLIAISFSVLKGFGFHRQMEPLLYNFLDPLGEKGVELTDRVIGFVENIQGDVLAGIGLALLFVTSISMAQKVEDSFNFIWRVERSRSLAQRLSEYLSILLLGPVVMVTALALIASLRSTAVVRGLTGVEPIGAVFWLVGSLAPYLLVVLAFSMVYWFLPNTRVQLRAALTGGVAGGVMWAATGELFATFVAGSARTLTIYSTFAIVIIALIWLYLCWLVLLVGAQIAFYVQYPEQLRIGYRQVRMGSRQREQMALSVMATVAAGFRRGAHPDAGGIADGLGLPELVLAPVIERLMSAGLLARDADGALLPSRDPGEMTVYDVLLAVRAPQPGDLFPGGHWPTGVERLTRELDALIEERIGTWSLYRLADDTATESMPDTRG